MESLYSFFGKFSELSKRKKSYYQVKNELAIDENYSIDPTPSTKTDDHSLKNADMVELEEQHQQQPQSGETTPNGKHFKKCLNVTDLLAFGIGGIIGAGIFVMTGVVAREKAGPGVIISYIIAGICCGLSGLCYAEFASKIPCSGSTYSYSYILVGELVAWIIGWDLTLEYMIASATVGRGWSGYLNSIIESGGGYLPKPFSPINLGSGFSLDIIAFLSILILSLIVAFGMKESARFNKIFVIIKIAIIIFVIILGGMHADTNNWSNFAPYGEKGIFNAAAITFFAYLGFDGVCNVAEEVANPQRDLPIGILGSLGISTLLYVAVCVVLTLMVPYNLLDLNAPLSVAFNNINLKWASIIVAIGAFAGLTTAQLGGLISQPRLYYSLSRDGLLPQWFGVIHPRFKTPFNATVFTGLCCATISLFVEINILADMVSIGTLLSFTLVSTCVLILRYPVPQFKHDSIAKYPVNKFPLFLQRPSTLVPNIIVFAMLTSLGYIKSLHYSIIIVFGFIGLCLTAIPFFFRETTEPLIATSKKSFLCPLVPFIPLVSIWANCYLMVTLSWGTWVRLVVWLLIGIAIYIFYGRKNSKLGRELEMEKITSGNSSSSSDSETVTSGNDITTATVGDNSDDIGSSGISNGGTRGGINDSSNGSGIAGINSNSLDDSSYNTNKDIKKTEKQPLSPSIASSNPPKSKNSTPLSSLSPKFKSSTSSPKSKSSTPKVKSTSSGIYDQLNDDEINLNNFDDIDIDINNNNNNTNNNIDNMDINNNLDNNNEHHQYHHNN